MDSQNSELLEKLRQQFNLVPYPRVPIEQSPKEGYEELFIHNLVTSYYLRHRRVIGTKDRLILDAGCGSGYKALMLAEANPGARIVGVDLSENSVQLARERLKHHGFGNVEFHALAIEELPSLGLQFDYINCDEVLYLIPDPLAGLQAMKAVLKPDGLIRTNLHNAYQRAIFYRSQALFRLMGVMDDTPGELQEEAVIETMMALKETTRLKAESWGQRYRAAEPGSEEMKELLYANQLLMGDKGFTIPDVFELLSQADLEFVSMVNWRHWDVADLFQDPNNLPALWGMGLASTSVAEQLHIYELLNPIHRLMDFWCTHPGEEEGPSLETWSEADWQTATVYLHPQLRIDALKQELTTCLAQAKAFEISKVVPLPSLAPVLVESHVAACLLPLWEGKQPIQVLVDRYQQLHPLHPITLEPTPPELAFTQVKDLLSRLDAFLYVLLEKQE